MEQTLDAFKSQQSDAIGILNKLREFLLRGEAVGIDIDPKLKEKLDATIDSATGEKLKVALIGGFSEGKTSIAAAWLEQLDRSTMNISHQESSNEVKVYQVGADFELIDTPGLFGFKEKFNADINAVEKYKDITRKYVSEAHLVLYVMGSANPIKASHQDDLHWLFRTLDLLPRTVFVLSRFDEVADVEDDRDYAEGLEIKRGNVIGRLQELIALSPEEAASLAIVAVAANPFDMGTEHWLQNLEEFRSLSRIATLQKATADKVTMNGGLAAIIGEAKKSVIRDVLDKQLPVAVANDEKIAAEVAKLETINVRMQKQLTITAGEVSDVRISLRQFVVGYFSDLILQARGVTLETFGEFFEREVGAGGVMIATRLQNEFERRISTVTLEVQKMRVGFESELNHFNANVRQYGKQGLDFVLSSKLINSSTVLATRDGVVTAAKWIGLDLGKMLKFKPWGAVNMAKGINGALSVLGLAIEAWDSWEQAQRREAISKAITDMVENFERQREELLGLINSDDFVAKFFPDYSQLEASVHEIARSVREREAQRQQFHEWRQSGEAIRVEFTDIAA
jgi:GTP-binding protein EngB required for normal cell division